MWSYTCSKKSQIITSWIEITLNCELHRDSHHCEVINSNSALPVWFLCRPFACGTLGLGQRKVRLWMQRPFSPATQQWWKMFPGICSMNPCLAQWLMTRNSWCKLFKLKSLLLIFLFQTLPWPYLHQMGHSFQQHIQGQPLSRRTHCWGQLSELQPVQRVHSSHRLCW